SLIDSYLEHAKEVAKLENSIWQEIFTSKDTIKEYELLFDIILKLKPYIFNIQTIKEYYKEKSDERAV
ncbi:MAG: MerR family transcriptional regulator, partial [Epsilonproteobacteria bacterium]|nr:MerR family transcriptional regulator [Campylobacterota bacterium]